MGNGKRIKFSNGRRLVDDVIRTARKMPMAAYRREFDLTELAQLRKKAKPKIAWNVLYMKAYAIVARRHPQLRQCYVGFPWPHAYEHEHNVCLLTMSREFEGEERLLFARFNVPETKQLKGLQEEYDLYRKSPVMDVRQFRHQIKFAKVPFLLRRLTWWSMLNIIPRKRMSHFGTFGMTLSRYKDAEPTPLLGPNTTILGVDIFPVKGKAKFILMFDHQILDGVPIVNIIEELYKVLNNEISHELKSLIPESSQSAAA